MIRRLGLFVLDLAELGVVPLCLFLLLLVAEAFAEGDVAGFVGLEDAGNGEEGEDMESEEDEPVSSVEFKNTKQKAYQLRMANAMIAFSLCELLTPPFNSTTTSANAASQKTMVTK